MSDPNKILQEREDTFADLKSLPLNVNQIKGFVPSLSYTNQGVSAIPNYTPNKFIQQFQIYHLSANTYLYIYDNTQAKWFSVQIS